MPERSEHIVLSRTDSIGDVMLTLPMAGLLKKRFPRSYISFLGRAYTVPVLERCTHIDNIITLEELTANGEIGAVEFLRGSHIDAMVHVFPVKNIARWAAQAGIPHRIGTGRRWWHLLHCNHRIAMSRRNSDLHEAQLNTKLLAPFGISSDLSTKELASFTGFFPPAPDQQIKDIIRTGRKNIILHPHSSGSAVEWGLENYADLIRLLDPGNFHVIITGTALEAERYRTVLPIQLSHVTDLGGKLDLHRLISLIGICDALVAASTGPLHIAAACGIRSIGIYANVRPIHPGRWAPIGRDAHTLAEDHINSSSDPLRQINSIGTNEVMRLLQELP